MLLILLGQGRFFKHPMSTTEERFPFRDYNYAVETATVDEISPRMDKLFLQIPALQPALKRISNRFRNDI